MSGRVPRGWLVLAVDWWPSWASAVALLVFAIGSAAGHDWVTAAVSTVAAAVFAAAAARNIRRNVRRGYLASRRELLTAAALLPLDVVHINREHYAGLMRVKLRIGGLPVTVVCRFPEGAQIYHQFSAPWWQVRVLHYIRPFDEAAAGRRSWRQQAQEMRALNRMTRTGAVYAEASEITELCAQIRDAEPLPSEDG